MGWFRKLLKNVFYEYPKRLFLAVKNGAKKALDALRAWAQRNPRTFKVVVIVLSAGLAAGAVYGLLAAIGFTSVGIAAGSLAAAWHSTIGAVSAGSLFAILQSLAATGMICAIGAGIGVAVPAIIMHLRKQKA